MTDKDFINKILNKNFTITFNDKQDDFVVKPLYDEGLIFSYTTFLTEVYSLIYGDTNPTNDTFGLYVKEWYDEAVERVVIDIISFIKKTKKNKGSVTLINRAIKKFSKKYFPELITKVCDDYYTKTYLIPNVNVFIEKLSSYGEVKGSQYLAKAFIDTTGLHENEKQIKIAKKIIVEWYEKNHLQKNIQKFLDQLILVLGPRNWEVKQIGSGKYDSISILKSFPNEDPSTYPLITQKFNEWYEEAVIKASESEMKKAYHTNVGDLVEAGKIKVDTKSIDDLDL